MDARPAAAGALADAELGLNDTGPRPKAAFLFMGPSGVGKTSTAKAFTEYLFGDSSLAMIFCNELQSHHAVPDLVRSIQRATQAQPSGTTLLVGEIEKAQPAVIDVFLSLLDEGQITTPDGSRLSIANCYAVLTSNLGSAKFSELEHTLYSTMETFAFNQARKILRPELFARLTETIVFRPVPQAVQERVLGAFIQEKLVHLGSRFNACFQESFSIPLTIEEKGVHAHVLRQEIDRQFNAACRPGFLAGNAPAEGRFYADPMAWS
jgi:ATP-dependent Clp protease ATP-binding subunit ClpC